MASSRMCGTAYKGVVCTFDSNFSRFEINTFFQRLFFWFTCVGFHPRLFAVLVQLRLFFKGQESKPQTLLCLSSLLETTVLFHYTTEFEHHKKTDRSLWLIRVWKCLHYEEELSSGFTWGPSEARRRKERGKQREEKIGRGYIVIFLFEEGGGAGKRDEGRVRSGSWRSWRVRRKSWESWTDGMEVKEESEREGRGDEREAGGVLAIEASVLGCIPECTWGSCARFYQYHYPPFPRTANTSWLSAPRTQDKFYCVCVSVCVPRTQEQSMRMLFSCSLIFVETCAVHWVSEHHLLSAHTS